MEAPKVTQLKSGEVYVSIMYHGKRKRIFNGRKYGIDITPNKHPVKNRLEIGKILAKELQKKNIMLKQEPLIEPSIEGLFNIKDKHPKIFIDRALSSKLFYTNSKNHKRLLKYAHGLILSSIKKESICVDTIMLNLSKYDNATSFNTIRAYIINLCNEATKYGMKPIKVSMIPRRKQVEKLHKPITDVLKVLNDIKAFNENLYVCCLITYGCLLRPHREIRKLKWDNFSHDLSEIYLSGSENKTGRNRAVPVPSYIKERLIKKNGNLNIFSGTETPYNDDYFKTLWGKYKRQSYILEEYQTLYSFRHSGAIEIYKRLGSLDKLKVAMGHLSLKSTLTYLRGLEISTLNEEDMPLL